MYRNWQISERLSAFLHNNRNRSRVMRKEQSRLQAWGLPYSYSYYREAKIEGGFLSVGISNLNTLLLDHLLCCIKGNAASFMKATQKWSNEWKYWNVQHAKIQANGKSSVTAMYVIIKYISSVLGEKGDLIWSPSLAVSKMLWTL